MRSPGAIKSLANCSLVVVSKCLSRSRENRCRSERNGKRRYHGELGYIHWLSLVLVEFELRQFVFGIVLFGADGTGPCRKRLGVSATAPRGLSGAEVLRAALDRSGMIVLVTLTTMASLVPLAIGTSSTTLFGAIALATAGGTIAGTVGAMFVLPSLVMG